MIRVINGVNEFSGDQFAGKTVAQIRRDLRQGLNLDPDSVPYVGGEKVTESYELESGDELEFMKASGVKGN